MINRLTELLEGVLDPDLMGETITQIAEHLTENGVIVPPVKVGETVYRTTGVFRGREIHAGVVDQVVVHNDDRKIWFYVHGHPIHFTADDLGRDVFFTREEAEKALRGEKND